MLEESVPGSQEAGPIDNLRITFWGVQGSCPVFPSPHGVAEYSRRLAVNTLTRLIADMQRKGRDGLCRVEDLLGGPPTPAAIDQYQRQLGLPPQPFYGGETTCVQVETADGQVIIFDAGTGLRRCAHQVTAQTQRTIHLFGSHEHIDHRSGLSFAQFCYVRNDPFTIRVFGTHQFLRALDHHYGIFSREVSDATYVDDPIDYSMMPAKFIPTELQLPDNDAPPGERHWDLLPIERPIQIGQASITPFEVYHGATRCTAYKVERGGKSFVFSTDQELRRGPDKDDPRQKRSEEAEARLKSYAKGVDLAYLDGQYFLEEYLGMRGIGSYPPVRRIDWGHSCIEDVIDLAFTCDIKRTLIGHHDPERNWPERAEIDQQLLKLSHGQPNKIQLADSDTVIDL